MLKPFQSDPSVQAATGWAPKGAFTKILVGTIIAALEGSLLWLLLPGPRLDWVDIWPAIGFGAFFGGWVGLISCLCFSFIRKVRQYATISPLRMILTFMVLSGFAGAPLFFPFGDGLAMALGLAIEAAVFGGIIGAVLGVCLFLMMLRQSKRQNTL